MVKRKRNGKVRQVSPLTSRPKLNGRKGVGDSDLYYFKDKGLIETTSKLEALVRTLLSGAIG